MHLLHSISQNQRALRRRAAMVAITLLSIAGAASSGDLTGQASVVDGDTLEIHGTRIRLWGIDAPEASQLCRGDDSLPYRCGAMAANKLDPFISRRTVRCLPKDLDQYGRTVASCSIETTDLGEWLVTSGLALDWPGKYDAAERDAQRAGRGTWAGSHIEPWRYRVCVRAGGQPAGCSDDANAHP